MTIQFQTIGDDPEEEGGTLVRPEADLCEEESVEKEGGGGGGNLRSVCVSLLVMMTPPLDLSIVYGADFPLSSYDCLSIKPAGKSGAA